MEGTRAKKRWALPLAKAVIQDCRCGLAAQLQVQRPHDPPLQRSLSNNWNSCGQSFVCDLHPIGDFRTLFCLHHIGLMIHQSINQPPKFLFSTSFLDPFYPALFCHSPCTPLPVAATSCSPPPLALHHLHFFWVNHPKPLALAQAHELQRRRHRSTPICNPTPPSKSPSQPVPGRKLMRGG